MPVHPVEGGGFEWGSHGKIYKGKGAKLKAARQGYAAMKHGAKEPGMTDEAIAKKLFGGTK